jgi:nicotinate-nucleotide adenylyltransferase
MKIALFFGSFNPIHIGHLIIANYIAETQNVDKVWLVVSPHNPLKEKSSLLNEYDRLYLVNLAIDGNQKLEASNIEFFLPKPSYTIDTLTYLKEKFPQHEFSLIMGGDNLTSISKWKNYELILKNHLIYLYNRPGHTVTENKMSHIKVLNVPHLEISSSFIRESIANGISMKYFLPDAVEKYITEMNIFKRAIQ